MDVKAAKRVSAGRTVFDRISGARSAKNEICRYWLAGNCNRNPCKYLHPESVTSHPTRSKLSWRNPSYHNPRNALETQPKVLKGQVQPKVLKSQGSGFGVKNVQKSQQQLCKYWVTGNCVHGVNCKNLHSWFYGDGFTLLAKLEGHTKAITGVALPPGSDKLYSASKDKSMRIWECQTGQCSGVVNLDGETGTLISEGPCVFVGLPSVVKVWNLQAQTEITLKGPVGQVHAMDVGNDMLFAGAQDGSILAWKTSSAEVAAVLKGHNGVVLSLVVGANRLYSSSLDRTIRVWDLETLQCLQILNENSSIVMSLLCWDSFLLAGSLDNHIKVWGAKESGELDVVYEHDVEQGVLALCGIHDAEAKPILLCSCMDNSVRLYDLPSFTERGRIFTKDKVQALHIGDGGLFFTGDATGQISVWKLNGKEVQ